LTRQEATVDAPRIGNVLYPVDDLDAAVAFYRDALGLPLKFTDGDRYAGRRRRGRHRRRPGRRDPGR